LLSSKEDSMLPAPMEELVDEDEKSRLAYSMIEVSKLTRALLSLHLATIALSPGEDDAMLSLSSRPLFRKPPTRSVSVQLGCPSFMSG
jgi:hypothetical protein